MRHLCFAAMFGAVLTAAPDRGDAQAIPGRDLLDFTIGALGEAPALGVATAGGLYNPAAVLLAPVGRVRGSLAHVNAQGDLGLTGDLLGVEWRPRAGRGLSLSLVRAAVGDIPRRGDGNPIDDLGTVAYDTFVASLGGAVRVQRHVAVGTALRYRTGRVDTTRAGGAGVDAGVIVDGLLGRRDLRLGASSFLWRPDAPRDDRPLGLAGADLRVAGRAAEREVRVGGSWLASRGGESEGYGYVSGRLANVEGRAGLARAALGGEHDTRTRFALGLRYARLLVSVARDESASGFGSVYQITLSSILR